MFTLSEIELKSWNLTSSFQPEIKRKNKFVSWKHKILMFKKLWIAYLDLISFKNIAFEKGLI